MNITISHPFTDPATSPRIKYLCNEKNINRGIIIEINAPVVNISQFSPLEPNNSLNFALKIISLGTWSRNIYNYL